MIKKILRIIILVSLSIYLANSIWQNIDYSQSLSIIIKASIVLTIFEYLVKPILKLLLLPVTILTLGLVKLVVNTLGLYIVEYFVENFNVSNINFVSQNWLGLDMPNIVVNNFWAYLVTSLTINIIYNLLNKTLVRVKKIKI